MEDKISIIIPVYNTEKFLVRCFESVINQTYKNLEIIVVNDGSTDESLKICENYARKDSRIILLNQKNGGHSVARNNALKYVSGKYIGFVDSDDYIQLDMYEKMIALMKKYNLDAVMCGFNIIDDTIRGNTNNDTEDLNEIKIDLDTSKIYQLILQDEIGSQLWKFLFKADLWKGILSPQGRFAQDMFVLHKVLFRAKKIGYTSEKLYNYYAGRPNNTSNSPNNLIKGGIDRAIAFYERYDFMIKNGYDSIADVVLEKAIKYATTSMALKICKQDLNFNEDTIYLMKLIKDHYQISIKSKNISIKIKVKLFLLVKYPILYKMFYKIKWKRKN